MSKTATHSQSKTATGTGPIVEARDVRKTYRLGRVQVPVLRGVDIAIDEGECVAVLGASGSGKSTLLHLLGGLDKPDQGDLESGIRFRGRKLKEFSSADLDRYRTKSVGFVFQFYHLLPELNVLENTLVSAMVGKNRISWAKEKDACTQRAESLLQRFGLGHRLKHRSVELSGGERQRVAIARALMNTPDLLLADEPTGNLDQKTGAEILDAMMSLREETNQTMVIVTHDQATAERADRIVRLVDGVVEGG
ncbi:MAG: ABC transporter ATP-binding protein [Phycisphaerales bacterium JB065]